MESSDRNNQKEEVNYSELIDLGKKLVTEDKNFILGEYNLNLSLLAPNIDNISKIQTLAIKSYIYYSSEKNLNVLLYLVKKIMKPDSKIFYENKFDSTIKFCFVRMLYRVGSLCEADYPYLAIYLLTKSKNIILDTPQLKTDSSSLEIIEKGIANMTGLISQKIDSLKDKFFNDENSFLKNKLKEIVNLFDNQYSNNHLNTDGLITPHPDKYFLISANWMKNMFGFVNKYLKLQGTEKFPSFIKQAFNKSNFFNLYNAEEWNENMDLSLAGIYPGPVNNFHIMQFKNFWFDPDSSQSHTNIYLKNGMKENSDFFYLREDGWNLIKEIFESNFEIERKIANLSNDQLIEVNLRKIKVLVLNPKLREKAMNLIQPKNIQISKELTIKNLKEKLKRCVNYFLYGESGMQLTEIKLYLKNFEMENKKEAFELIYSYCNRDKNFKMIAEEVIDENTKMEEFKYAPGDLLIVEIDSDFLQIIKEDKNCFNCSKLIGNDLVKCQYCTIYLYCSEKCRKSDEIHLKYHNNIQKLLKKKFDLNELFLIRIEDLLERDSRHGLVGLKNLGNTCFMNSAIQCLSHCEDLTKYFLTKKVFDEINRSNKDGTRGEVAKAYHELITELWQGENKYLCPSDFRQIFVRFVRQFSGFSQHDSNEMLTFMLDTLNEDLNRVKEKPYIEMKEKLVNETDKEASQRWWKNHLSRENSIIVDLFYGQFKSIITCPECSRISITYDPFMCLGLPIPSGHFKIKFKYFTYSLTDQNKQRNYYYEYDLPINENTSVKEMKKKVIAASRNGIKYDYLEAICFTKEKTIKKIMREEDVIYPFFDNGLEIAIYEKFPSNKADDVDDLKSFYLLPVEFIQERNFLFMSKTSSKLLSYPDIISLKFNQTINDLYKNVYKIYRKIIPDPDKFSTYSKFIENYNNDNYINTEFKKYFSTSEDKFPFRLHICNNIPESSSYFSSKINCEYCNSKCEHCPIINEDLTFEDKIENLFDKQRIPRPFILYVEFTNYFKNSRIFENIELPLTPTHKNLISKQEEINIYDCINLFRTEERLEKENAWYCSGCKKHQEAFKKMELYRVPNYLIVQFKRFKIKTAHVVMGMISNRKNDVFIDYPVEGLNLSEYIVGEEKNEAIYDLVGISQHFGSLSSGHYTALCRNFNNWYDFDDSSVSKVSNSDIVNESAYMLFYKKRNLGKR